MLNSFFNDALAPIEFPEEKLIESCRETFRAQGLCILENFLTPDVLAHCLEEAAALAPEAFHQTVHGNPYLESFPLDAPPGHPRHFQDSTALGVVAYDQFPKHSPLRILYEWEPLLEFVEAVVNRGPIFRYDCPLGALNLAVMKSGDHLRWHFDQSDFVVSLVLQNAETGGDYEYVRGIRSEENENYDEVAAVLRGDSARVRRLKLPAGSLIFFEGRHTIHRVTRVQGDTPRLVALLGYTCESGIRSSAYLQQIRYGRSVSAHV